MWSNNETVSQKKRSFIEEARRAPIVPAAIDTLAEVGYGQASLAKIAARAGVSKGVISYHFAGKADLMEHLVIEVYTRGAHFMIPQIQAEPNAPGMLRAAIKSNLAFIATNRAAIAAVMEVMANLRAPDGALRFDLAADEPNVYEVEWILQKGQEEGDFRAFDTRVMALAIRAAIDRSAALFRAEPHRPAGVRRRDVVGLRSRDPTARYSCRGAIPGTVSEHAAHRGWPPAQALSRPRGGR